MPVGLEMRFHFRILGVAQDRQIDSRRNVIVGEVLGRARIDDQHVGAEVLHLQLVRVNQPRHCFQGVRLRNERFRV